MKQRNGQPGERRFVYRLQRLRTCAPLAIDAKSTIIMPESGSMVPSDSGGFRQAGLFAGPTP